MTNADPIVLIPGFMGSKLARLRDNQQIWIDPLWALTNLAGFARDLALRAPDDPKLYPSGVLHDVDIGDIVRIGVYRKLWQFALSAAGLGLSPSDYHEFAYDWRKSVLTAATELDAVLLGFSDPTRKITLIAHSQGGHVVAMLFHLGGPGSRRVGKVVAVGCPFAGLLKTLRMINEGSGVLSHLLPTDPIRELLGAMPGSYELMPSRQNPALFTDASGIPSTPFACAASLPGDRFDTSLLQAAASIVTPWSLSFPVPVRLIEGYGNTTAISATLQGGFAVKDGQEGDGTCPAVSLLAAQGTSINGVPDRTVFSVPFGEHVGLVSSDEVLAFLREDLLGLPAPAARIAAKVRHELTVPGNDNLLIVETRNGVGAALGTGKPQAILSGHGALPLAPCPIAGQARWLASFKHPLSLETIEIRVPGVAENLQPKRIVLVA